MQPCPASYSQETSSLVYLLTPFEISQIWKCYGKWSICSSGANASVSKNFQKYSKFNLNFSRIFQCCLTIENDVMI